MKDDPRNKPLSLKLKDEGRSNDFFEVMLQSLTLEEMLALKLELTLRSFRGKFINMPLLASWSRLSRSALFRAVCSLTKHPSTQAALLGINEPTLTAIKNSYPDDFLIFVQPENHDEAVKQTASDKKRLRGRFRRKPKKLPARHGRKLVPKREFVNFIKERKNERKEQCDSEREPGKDDN